MNDDTYIPDIGLIKADGSVNEDLKPLGNKRLDKLSILFDERSYYSDYIVPYVNQSVVNSPLYANLIEQSALFGLVNVYGEVIYRTDNSSLKQIPSADENPKYVFNFIADAFNAMNTYLKDAAIQGKISKNGLFYNLKCFNKSVTLNDYLKKSQNLLINRFLNLIENVNSFSSQIKDAKTYTNKFAMFLKQRTLEDIPVTKTSNILSSNFTYFFNGLIIDIAKEDADNDTNKFDKFLTNSEFPYFADATKRFGFVIDSNVPWRLIADMNSPAMKNTTGNHTGYMLKYGYTGIDDLYYKKFSIAYYDELEYLKELFYSGYKKIVELYPNYEPDNKKLDSCDLKHIKPSQRPFITKEEYYKLVPDTHWLRIYVYLRSYEEKINFQQQQFDNLVREANNFVSAGLNKDALKFINSYFKQFRNVAYLSSLQKDRDPVKQNMDSRFLHDLRL